jgi:5'-methylthioadenosine phosphorylase
MVDKRENAEIGIIGGTGIYDPGIMEEREEVEVHTPYGDPSDFVTTGIFGKKRIAFIPRHGKGHRIPPHRINFRANIWALKDLGVKRIISPSAVGSLADGAKPSDLVIPDQFIDLTKNRPRTFYEGGQVCHISVADPFCPELRDIAIRSGVELGLKIHGKGTYICIEGPRYSTRAESKLFRTWGADIVGMTLVPECILAREVEICYLTMAAITDYDVWAEKPVTTDEVMKTLSENADKITTLLKTIIPRIPIERKCSCGNALSEALV